MFPGQRVGKFEIEKELGSGAMGSVYRARYELDGRVVALKVIAFGLLGNESALARFEREADILKQLKHPHVVRLFGYGRYKQTPFIAMEFIDGEALDRILGRRGRLGWEEVVGYGKQLCSALQYAHEKGIIHRDLKPSNLMVTRDGTLKLTDFGIAKDTDVTALTGANSTIGTAAYMSPEQCKGDRNLSNKSDLYSLGVVFYELLTGKKPFTADTTIDMFTKHVYERPVRPSRLTPDVPVWLDNLVMFLLEKEKDQRPLDAATVGAMLADIEEKMAGQQSAGAAVANARRFDRPLAEGALDSDDIAAAKSLKAAKAGGKKKKKKKAGPPAERRWLRAVPLVLGLVAVVAGGVFLFNRQSGGGGGGGGSHAAAPADLREERGRRLEIALATRFRNKDRLPGLAKPEEDEDEPAYTAAWAAIEVEEKGDLSRAVALWEKVKARAPEAHDKHADAWGWLADKRLADARAADGLIRSTREAVVRQQLDEAAWAFDPTDPKALAAVAVRLGGAGGLPQPDTGGLRQPLPYLAPDPARVRKAWADLADLTKDKPDLRAWFLLAVREREKLKEPDPEKAVVGRRKAVADLLAAVRREWQRVGGSPDFPAEQRDVRNRLRDIVELYGDESDEAIKASVEAAKKLFAEARKVA